MFLFCFFKDNWGFCFYPFFFCSTRFLLNCSIVILAEERKYCNIVLFQRLDGNVYIQNQITTEMGSSTCVVLHVSVICICRTRRHNIQYFYTCFDNCYKNMFISYLINYKLKYLNDNVSHILLLNTSAALSVSPLQVLQCFDLLTSVCSYQDVVITISINPSICFLYHNLLHSRLQDTSNQQLLEFRIV